MKPKIIITTNPVNHEGGVVNYYNVIFRRFSSSEVDLVRLIFGSRMEYFYLPYWQKALLYPFFYCQDFIRLIWTLLTDRSVRIVQVSPSLIPVPLWRDAPIVLLARLMRRKTIVFFRGWKDHELERIRSSRLRRWAFLRIYGQCDRTFVLLSKAERDLRSLGYPGEIHRTTTLYDKEEIIDMPIPANPVPVFLFLGRVDELKGIFEIIEACRLVRETPDCPPFRMEIVGHEAHKGLLEECQRKTNEANLNDIIHFYGRKNGQDRMMAYHDADIYVFPSWTEGCPNSVLEAMGNGLYVVGSTVGALPDLITSPDYGILVPPRDATALAGAMREALDRLPEIRSRRKLIRQYAENTFEVSHCIEFLKNQYRKILS